ncbi:MAG: response regulator [Anaeromyxobacter sp.]
MSDERTKGPADLAASQGPRTRAVLVVDDEPLLLSALRRLLVPRFRVETFDDAAQALERIRGGARFEAILCDLNMPGMDGVAFHDALAAALPEQARRIVFMTGGALGERSQRVVRSGRHRVLEKPLERGALLRALDGPPAPEP